MLAVAVFGLVVIIMIFGGMLLARLATVAKSKGSWMWGMLHSDRTYLRSTFSTGSRRVVSPL